MTQPTTMSIIDYLVSRRFPPGWREPNSPGVIETWNSALDAVAANAAAVARVRQMKAAYRVSLSAMPHDDLVALYETQWATEQRERH